MYKVITLSNSDHRLKCLGWFHFFRMCQYMPDVCRVYCSHFIYLFFYKINCIHLLFYSDNSCRKQHTTEAFAFISDQTAITIQNNYNLQVLINDNNRSI